MSQPPLLLHHLRAEREPPLELLRAERDPLTLALLREAPPPTAPPWPTPTITPHWERDPLTLPLLQEAYPKASAEWLHHDIGQTPPPGTERTPSSSSARRRPQVTDAQARAIDRNRIWATTDAPISAEAKAEAHIVLSVLADRRRRATWKGEQAFDGWHQEAQDTIAATIPTRRALLQDYADRRALIRRKRRSWTLAEHITALDAALDTMEVPRD